jgi:hypothetical protein
MTGVNGERASGAMPPESVKGFDLDTSFVVEKRRSALAAAGGTIDVAHHTSVP